MHKAYPGILNGNVNADNYWVQGSIPWQGHGTTHVLLPLGKALWDSLCRVQQEFDFNSFKWEKDLPSVSPDKYTGV